LLDPGAILFVGAAIQRRENNAVGEVTNVVLRFVSIACIEVVRADRQIFALVVFLGSNL
jgi:hypothetical protein